MISLAETTLAKEYLDTLVTLQDAVNAKHSFADKVSAAKDLFASTNTRTNPLFVAVRHALDAMCCGVRRCMYCEDSAADEVEHFKPKRFYPDLCFIWTNYLYACGSCNTSKGSRWAVRKIDGSLLLLQSKPKLPPEPPPEGLGLLIDPRSEDPFAFLKLDLETFRIESSPALADPDQRRAEMTINFLKMNRDLLIRARRTAFEVYINALRLYASSKREGVPESRLMKLREYVGGLAHPTVWREMIRQRDQHAELAELFGEAEGIIE